MTGTDAQMDPRIEERREEVQREQRNRRVRVGLLVASVFLAAGVAYLALESPLLDVDHLRVEGTVHLDDDAVRAAAGIETGEPMWRLDLGAARSRLEALPWVASASVTRTLPGTVRIAVAERSPVAFVRRDAQAVALLAADGRVVADVPAPLEGLVPEGLVPEGLVPEGLVEVRGVRRAPAVGALLSPPDAPAVLVQLPDALRVRVEALDLSGDGLTLELVGGGAVRLGTADDVDAKAAAALAVLQRLGDEPFEYVDVRVPHTPVAR